MTTMKIRSLLRRRKTAPPPTAARDLWWVRVILNVGRPVVAVIVLVMCAPGEHYLAEFAGWSDWLAWGMPATLTAYAGIAAVVATKRPKDAPGKKTAVAGAIISVTLAMGAQPIAHLYQLGLISGHRMPLTIVVSCIPALVFGHLLHMAAAPSEAPLTRDNGGTDMEQTPIRSRPSDPGQHSRALPDSTTRRSAGRVTEDDVTGYKGSDSMAAPSADSMAAPSADSMAAPSADSPADSKPRAGSGLTPFIKAGLAAGASREQLITDGMDLFGSDRPTVRKIYNRHAPRQVNGADPGTAD